MKQQYVKKCSCCERRFIRIKFCQHLPISFEDRFVRMLADDVAYANFSGTYYLSEENEEIVDFYYEFKNKDEEKYSEDLYGSVIAINNFLHDEYVRICIKDAEANFCD